MYVVIMEKFNDYFIVKIRRVILFIFFGFKYGVVVEELLIFLFRIGKEVGVVIEKEFNLF